MLPDCGWISDLNAEESNVSWHDWTWQVVREHISTTTLILLAAAAGKRLERLYVRRNALLLRADWPKSLQWSAEYHAWLRKTALSYEATQMEVSLLLEQKWKPLTDKEFKSIKISVHDDPWMANTASHQRFISSPQVIQHCFSCQLNYFLTIHHRFRCVAASWNLFKW